MLTKTVPPQQVSLRPQSQENRTFFYKLTVKSDPQQTANKLIERIEECFHRREPFLVELSALNNAIEHCLRVSYLVQSRF